MDNRKTSPTVRMLTDFIFEAFRLHGQLIAFGDQLVGDYGLTSARWQILGSIALSDQDLTVSMVARNIGLSRQAIQRVTNDLVREGFISYGDNPHHKRAKLLLLTDKGQTAFDQSEQVFNQWAEGISPAFSNAGLLNTQKTMRTLAELCAAHQKKMKKECGK